MSAQLHHASEPQPGHAYIHVPYCQAKCPYCDFNSIAGRQNEFADYTAALCAEIATLPPGPYSTIFVGGGTPSILPPELWQQIGAALHQHLDLTEDYEWTMEANPGSVDSACFQSWSEIGVNRVSLGIQSLRDADLQFLGRVHTHDEAMRALALALEHFPRVSADIIIGLPEQSVADIDAVIKFYETYQLQHASVYSLMIEPGTEFYARHRRGDLPTAEAEVAAQQLTALYRGLKGLGLEAYETSNFATPGQACRHNLGYWYQHDYVAAGAGAVSLTDRARHTRHKHPAHYIAASQDQSWINHTETLSADEWLVETWMLGLRLRSGVKKKHLASAGDHEERWRSTANRLLQQGLIMETKETLSLTEEGRVLQDAVTVALLPE